MLWTYLWRTFVDIKNISQAPRLRASLCSANRDTVVCVALTTYHTCQVEGELDIFLPFDKEISLKTIHNITQLLSNAPFFIQQNCHQGGIWGRLFHKQHNVIFFLQNKSFNNSKFKKKLYRKNINITQTEKIERLKTRRLNSILFTRRLVNITSPPSPIF